MGSSDKKLPRSTTLGAVRLLCEKLFKVKAGQQALYLRAPGDPLPEDITCEEDSRTLGELGVQVTGRESTPQGFCHPEAFSAILLKS
jgi:hypothetical protein